VDLEVKVVEGVWEEGTELDSAVFGEGEGSS
jgi:hypothetical protein